MLLLGIDSGLRVTGWGLVEIHENEVDTHTNGTSKKKGRKKSPLATSKVQEKKAGIQPEINVILKAKNIKIEYRNSGLIKTSNKKETLEGRLCKIFTEMKELIKLHKPKCCAIENTYVNSNYRTSIYLAQARAAAIMACYECGLIPTTYEAKTIKKNITGSGQADKTIVANVVNELLSIKPDVKHKTDVTDALAVAICHAFNYNPLQN